MKKTKEVILETALALFNAKGLPQVTLRTIANEMEISQGNLTYHYKKREEIIEALYFQLVQKNNEAILTSQSDEVSLQTALNVTVLMAQNHYEYRFLLFDFMQVMRENKAIRQHYLTLGNEKKEQFRYLIETLVKKGLMRPEKLPDEYSYLYKRVRILNDFWLSAAETATGRITKKTIANYCEMVRQSFFPYLTAAGEEEYFAMTKK